MTQCESSSQNRANDRDTFEELLSKLVELADEQAVDLACHVQEGGEPYKLDEWAYTAVLLNRSWNAVKASIGPGPVMNSERNSYHHGRTKLMDEFCAVINDLLDGKFEKRWGLLEPWASTHDRLVARLRREAISQPAEDGWVLASDREPELDKNEGTKGQKVRCLVNLENGEVFEAAYTRNPHAATEKGRKPRWESEGRILSLPVYAWMKMPTGRRSRERSQGQD